jgi:hypothetical protein
MYHYFYKITNKYNGKFYYGVHSTEDLNDGYMGSGSMIKRLYRKYGTDCFTKEILKFFDCEEKMFEYEQQIITEELVNDPNCYNLTTGGKGYRLGHPCPDEVRKNISEKNIGKPSVTKGYKYYHKDTKSCLIPPELCEQYENNGWLPGPYISPESRERLRSYGMKGKHISAESRKLMSDIKKRQFAEGTWISPSKGVPMSEEQKEKLRQANLGKILTQEHKEKIRKAQTDKVHNYDWKRNQSIAVKEWHKQNPIKESTKQKIGMANSKPILRIDVLTGETTEFASIKDAEISLGFKPGNSSIYKYCKLPNKSYKSYYWRYKE